MARQSLGAASTRASDLPTRGEVELRVSRTGATVGWVPRLQTDGTLAFAAPAEATSLYASASTGVSGGGLATIPLDTTDFADRAGMLTLGAGGQVTINTTGLYLLTARAYFSGSGTGARNVFFNRNGTTFAEIGSYNSGATVRVSGALVARFTAGDAILMRVFASSADTVSGGGAKDTGVTFSRMA